MSRPHTGRLWNTPSYYAFKLRPWASASLSQAPINCCTFYHFLKAKKWARITAVREEKVRTDPHRNDSLAFLFRAFPARPQWKRDTIAERTKDALRLKIVKHERAGQVPYGWTLTDDGKTLVENAAEQGAISLARNLNAKGCSLRAICRELEKEGHQPIGRRWHAKTVRSILKKAA
jgi:hypothetical protein